MFDINIQTRVTLPSGASIELTPDQHKQINNFVMGIVTGKTKVTATLATDPQTDKTNKAKRFKQTPWTTEEKQALEMMWKAVPVGTKGQEASKRRKEWIIHLQKTTLHRHTKKQIYAMYFWMGGKQRAAREMKKALDWNPVVIKQA